MRLRLVRGALDRPRNVAGTQRQIHPDRVIAGELLQPAG